MAAFFTNLFQGSLPEGRDYRVGACSHLVVCINHVLHRLCIYLFFVDKVPSVHVNRATPSFTFKNGSFLPFMGFTPTNIVLLLWTICAKLFKFS